MFGGALGRGERQGPRDHRRIETPAWRGLSEDHVEKSTVLERGQNAQGAFAQWTKEGREGKSSGRGGKLKLEEVKGWA